MNKILKAFLLTIAGALLVGVLKERQIALTALLVAVLVAHLIRHLKRHHSWQVVAVEVFNLVTFGTIGFLTEFWGTHNGHWTYYHLPEGQTVPLWVPVAWAIAAVILGKSEEALTTTRLKCKQGELRFVELTSIYLLGMLLPLAGESICISLGVWEYHWPFKVIGVPFLALVLIGYAHFVFNMIRVGGKHFWRSA